MELTLAHAPSFPIVVGDPIPSKPRKVIVKLRLRFFDVFVFRPKGERSCFRLPLRRKVDDLGCKGLMVVNIANASVGLVDFIALVGQLRRPTLTADILVHATAPGLDSVAPLALASALVLGTPMATAGPLAQLPVGPPAPAVSPFC
jgi:hypothetical protein